MHKVSPPARVLVALLAAILSLQMLVAADAVRAAATIRVPQDYASIQAAVDAASPGDTIEIAPGIYTENVTVDRSISLVAAAYDQNNPRNNTVILDGAGGVVIRIGSRVVPGPTLAGLVIRNGSDGIFTRSLMTVEHSYFTGNVDSFQTAPGGGGVVSGNVFADATDDALDMNGPTEDLTIEDNEIRGSKGDGFEIRLFDGAIADTAEIVIRGNRILDNTSDGIQLIDYYEDTNRVFVIERNLLRGNGQAAIGLMDRGNTNEDFRGASIRERILVFHNTFVDNDHGISGGDNLIALNNIFQGHTLAMKNVDANSIVSYNIFWNNAVDAQGSIIDAATTLSTDPLLDSSSQLRPGSPAIDAGTAHFEWRGEVVMDQPSAAYNGAAPDLGWLEHVPGSDSSPSINSFTPGSGPSGTSVTIDGSNFTDATEVRFAGTPASFSVDSDTRITAVVPSAATTGKISVIGPGGTGTSATSFTVPILGRVTVADFSFKPKTLQVSPGSVVQWLFRGPSSHAATDSIGLGPTRAPLFDSGPKGTGEVYEFEFAAAGSYPYSSAAAEPTAMTGTIKVPVTIAPITGTTATEFTVTWASKSLPGFGFSVQSRFQLEGSSTFTKWTSFGPVQTAPSGVFVPDRGPGTYQFRSQLKNSTTGAASLRSTPTSITVTS